MGKLRSSRSKREPLALRIHKRLALAASVATFAYSLGVQVAAADTTATWTFETSGNWTSPSLWSTSPNIPNNGTPTGVDYQALINATGGTPYTVTLNSNISVDSLTLDSPDATLDQTVRVLTPNMLDISSGTYLLDGATISGGTVNSTGGTFLNANSVVPMYIGRKTRGRYHADRDLVSEQRYNDLPARSD